MSIISVWGQTSAYKLPWWQYVCISRLSRLLCDSPSSRSVLKLWAQSLLSAQEPEPCAHPSHLILLARHCPKCTEAVWKVETVNSMLVACIWEEKESDITLYSLEFSCSVFLFLLLSFHISLQAPEWIVRVKGAPFPFSLKSLKKPRKKRYWVVY